MEFSVNNIRLKLSKKASKWIFIVNFHVTFVPIYNISLALTNIFQTSTEVLF